jgi:hypothetical protein
MEIDAYTLSPTYVDQRAKECDLEDLYPEIDQLHHNLEDFGGMIRNYIELSKDVNNYWENRDPKRCDYGRTAYLEDLLDCVVALIVKTDVY